MQALHEGRARGRDARHRRAGEAVGLPWQWTSAGKKGPRGDINVTPLIDVVLVLLIIFMVLTPSMLKHLTATVPKKAEDDTPQPPAETPSWSSTPPSAS